MSDTLFDLSPYNSETAHSYSPDWRDADGSDPAWDEPNSESKSQANTQDPSADVPTEWRSAAEFTLTFPSGQTVEVKFIPGLVGERRMHEFSFTGPVSLTGFKSHFVLALEAEELPHPRDYAQAYAEKIVARFEAGQQQQAKSKKRSRPMAEAQTPQGQATDNDSSRQETTMAADETDVLNYPRVEVVEELSPEEESDRQRLELKVERAFYESGKALLELRSRRLYRSTHKSFEDYCQDRFEFNRTSAHHKIRAAEIFENLFTKSKQSGATDVSENLFTKIKQVLPTKETQIRALTKLEPEEQCQVWQEAVEAAEGKVPTERIVKEAVLRHKGVVDCPNQKYASPEEFTPGDVVEIKALFAIAPTSV